MIILGISAFYHDSAAALVSDGRILAAAQEERFTRKKHDPSFPRNAAAYCLTEAGIGADDLDYVVFYEKPFLKFERLLETYLAYAPRGLTSFHVAAPLWVKEKLFQRRQLEREVRRLGAADAIGDRLLFAEHHRSHAASAFFPSPFEEAAVLTMDGVGEWATTTAGYGRANKLEITKEIHFPHSLGLLYAAFTYYTGFKVNSGEYKVMGLAPYGEPRYASRILEHLIDLKSDGSFRLNMDYFDYCTGLRMINERFHDLFGGGPRHPDEPLTQRDMDLAASVQSVTDEAVLRLTDALARETGDRNLAMAGGVALNCVANGKVLKRGSFDRVWIQPAAGDAGGALGAALSVYHDFAGRPRTTETGLDAMNGSFLGPSFDQFEVERRLTEAGASFQVLSESEVLDQTAGALQEGKVVAWFQGRMEFGPRALGARSILADPRSPTMQSLLNMKVKFRESFRPFAPAVLREAASDWFELATDSPYMLLVADVVPSHRRPLTDEQGSGFGIERLKVSRSDIPAVTHLDYSARIQTVHRETNPLFHALLTRFRDRTGCPVLVNTSFNVRGEPIVCSPEDAFRCFMGTDIDVLVAGQCFMTKGKQPMVPETAYAAQFAPD
jgi:carbamoyltransferase